MSTDAKRQETEGQSAVEMVADSLFAVRRVGTGVRLLSSFSPRRKLNLNTAPAIARGASRTTWPGQSTLR
jgi:hypothetical protein